MQKNFNYDVVAKVIQDANPDFVALQEVDFKTSRSSGKDLATELGLKCKMVPLFARAIDFDKGEYGVGILSRYPFLKTQNNPLPSTSGHEARTSLIVTTKISSGDIINLVCTHIDYLPEGDRIAQAKQINKLYSKEHYPTILAGDFNDIPGSDPIKLLEKKWGITYDKNNPEPTFPSNKPKVKIDYVMFAPVSRWKVIHQEVIHNDIASDHCAYLVTLKLIK